MYRRLIPLFLIVGVLGAGSQSLAAEEHLETCLGRILINTDPEPTPALLKSVRVRTTIRDRMALTRIEQAFENNSGKVSGGTFECRLPQDATLIGFATDMHRRMCEAEVVARADFPATLDALLAEAEQDGGHFLRAHILPMGAGAGRTIAVSFAQVIERNGDVLHFSLPLMIEDATDFEVDIVLRSASGIRELSYSGIDLQVRNYDDHARLRFQAKRVTNAEPLKLQWQREGGQKPLELVFARSDKDRGYVMALVSPPADATERRPVNVLFLADQAALAGGKNAPLGRVLSACARQLAERDRYNIIVCGAEPHLLLPEFVDNLPGFRDLALKQIAAARSDQPDLGKALLAAGRTIEEDNSKRRTHVIYVGAGPP